MANNVTFRQSKICCISDIHAGIHQNNSLWHSILIKWSRWLKTELNKHDIKDIVISGDLFHYRDEININTLHIVTTVLNIWKSFNIVILVGNHDAYYKDRSDVNSLSILDGWDNITIVDKLTAVKCFNRTLTFCPWGTVPAKIKQSDIVFGHFEIENFKMTQWQICFAGIESKFLLEKSPLIISGHFHTRESRKYKNGEIVYLGNPFQLDFGDVNQEKGYTILDIKTNKHTFHKNDLSPIHKKILLSQLVKIGSITDEVRSWFTGTIVKFVIDKNISPDEIDELLLKLSSYNPISMILDYTVNFNKFGINDQEKQDLSEFDIATAITEFIELLDIENKNDIINYTIDLYKRSK